MPHDLSQTRVVKKLGVDQPGAKKLARRFGDDLVCVRYRQDAGAGQRYTTVEIVVDAGPMPADKRLPAQVHVRIALNEQALQRTVKQNGAEWDRQAYRRTGAGQRITPMPPQNWQQFQTGQKPACSCRRPHTAQHHRFNSKRHPIALTLDRLAGNSGIFG